MLPRSSGVALLLVCLGVSPSVAAEPPVLGMGIDHPAKASELGDKRIYQITFECKKLADPTRGAIANALIKKNMSNSHVIVISSDLPTKDAETKKLKYSESPTAFFPVFSVTNGILSPDNREACPNDSYVYGGRKLYVIGIASFATANEPGWLTSMSYGIAGLIPPLWSMFKGNISDDVSNRITKYKETEDPLKKTLQALDRDENYSVTQEISPDVYIINTAFSSVTIKVKYIRSILRDGTQAARNAFRKQLESGDKLTATDLANTCSKIAAELIKLGFSVEEDVPFGLGYKAINSTLTRDQIVECLGPDYALAAANMKDLQDFAPKSKKLDPAKIEQLFPPPDPSVVFQPPYAVNSGNLDRFNRAIATVTRGKDMTPADQAKLSGLLAPGFSLQDETIDKIFGGGAITSGGEALAKALIDAGYRRFGCNQATELGKSADGGTALLLAFKADADRKTLPISSVIVLKPFFDKNKITKIIAYDEYDWINTVMQARGYTCNGTVVEKPPTEKNVTPDVSG